MRKLLAATFLTPFVLAAPAAAETVIAAAVTAPVATGTANDDIRISSTGSVRPTGGAAVTINSNDAVRNEGTIAITGANGSTGILANTNLTGNITNTGTITIDETFAPTDTDNDGDIDGPFAQGNNRYAIRVLGGGTYTGTINNSGIITVEGNVSAGIAIDSALTGSILNSGGITVTGDNSVGLRASSVSGNVTISSGTISVRGAGSVGVQLGGDIGGALVFQGAVTSTGYRSTTPPADVSRLDADDLLQGGSAIVIGGNVAGGILFDAPPVNNSTTDDDEDDDGIVDATETIATITSFGAAPAVVIGSSSQDILVGAVGTSTAGHGLVVRGTIGASGVYRTVSATALSIGGTGHSVTIAGGMTVAGAIAARAIEANATAVRIGSGASVPVIDVSGTVSADGAGTATSIARAILIESGASVATLRNSGTINAGRTAAAGTAAAIVDLSGTLNLIENRGSIGVTNAAALGDNAIAFDLRANAGGATVRQLAAATGRPAPTIDGNMLFGAGNDLLEVADGTVTGAARFGAGDNMLTLSGDSIMTGAVVFGGGTDAVQLAGTSNLIGNIDFGGGAGSLNLTGTSLFRGNLANSAALAVNVGAGSTLDVTNTATVNLASLTTGAGSTIGVTLGSPTTAFTVYNISGAANFGTNTTVDVNLLTVGGVAGSYAIIQAGSLTGAGNLATASDSLPFLYASSLNTTTPGQVSLVVRVKTAAEFGLNASEGNILNAVIGAADRDAAIASVFLGIDDSAGLRDTLQQMLPDHAGGAFETATKGSRQTARFLLDPNPPLADDGKLGFWVQQVAWGKSKAIGATSSYKLSGWGASGGVETGVGALGSVGLSLAYLSGRDSENSHELVSNQFEGGLYWRGGSGPLRGFARATAGRVKFDGSRTFSATANNATITRTADGQWSGTLYSAIAGVAYDARMGRLSLRPTATIEHLKLSEKGYSETGGGDAFNLTVDKRSSSESAATGALAIGYDLLGRDPTETSDSWVRIELEGGRRQLIGGSLGTTRANFTGGQAFTLTPEKRSSGWLAGFRLLGGGAGYALSGEVNAEQQQGRASIGGRISLQFAM